MDSPLLFRISEKKRLVQFAADEFERLLFKGDGRSNRGVALSSYECLGLGRGKRGSKELVDGQQVDRQRIDGSARDCFDPVVVGLHGGKAVDVRPHVFMLGVEDVRTIGVDHDPGFMPTGVAIAGYMITRVKYPNPVTGLSQLSCHHSP